MVRQLLILGVLVVISSAGGVLAVSEPLEANSTSKIQIGDLVFVFVDRSGQEQPAPFAAWLPEFESALKKSPESNDVTISGGGWNARFLVNRFFAAPSGGDPFSGDLIPVKGRKGGISYYDRSGTLRFTVDDGLLSRTFQDGRVAIQAGHMTASGPSFARWGFIDVNGKWVVPTVYDDVTDFSEGLAAVAKQAGDLEGDSATNKAGSTAKALDNDMLWGYIDAEGRTAIPFQFRSAGRFVGGLAPVTVQDGAAGFIDKKGNLALTSERWGSTGEFSKVDELAPALIGRRDASSGEIMGRYGYVDRTGKTAIEPQFSDAKPFSEGLAAVAADDGKWGFVDTAGKFAIKPVYIQTTAFHNGLALVRLTGPGIVRGPVKNTD